MTNFGPYDFTSLSDRKDCIEEIKSFAQDIASDLMDKGKILDFSQVRYRVEFKVGDKLRRVKWFKSIHSLEHFMIYNRAYHQQTKVDARAQGLKGPKKPDWSALGENVEAIIVSYATVRSGKIAKETDLGSFDSI